MERRSQEGEEIPFDRIIQENGGQNYAAKHEDPLDIFEMGLKKKRLSKSVAQGSSWSDL